LAVGVAGLWPSSEASEEPLIICSFHAPDPHFAESPPPPAQPPTHPALPINTAAGMPPVVDPNNLYSKTGAGAFSPAVAAALPLVYVPNLRSDDVYVID
jgi:YVTN family beta-propeller protein